MAIIAPVNEKIVMRKNDIDILNETLFEDIAYELDDYISSSSNPAQKYRNEIIPFFIIALKKFNSVLNDSEKVLLSKIEIIWNTSGSIDVRLMDEIRKEISSYEKSLSIDNYIHRYLAACLEHLTYQFLSDSEVSLIWLYLSGLIRASISRNWLYGNLIERYSQCLSDKIIKLKI